MMDLIITTFVLSRINLLVLITIILYFILKLVNRAIYGRKNRVGIIAVETEVDKGIARRLRIKKEYKLAKQERKKLLEKYKLKAQEEIKINLVDFDIRLSKKALCNSLN